MVHRAATGAISGVFEVLVGICVALYVICTVITTAALGQFELTKLTAESLTSGPMIFFFAVELIYMAVWFAFAGVWLGWYSAVIDWARSRGAPVPGNLKAIAFFFVPGLNFVHPWLTMRSITKHTEVRTPLAWWWWLFIGSLVLGMVGSLRGARGTDPFILVGTGMEIVAAILCWKVVRDFRRADREWDPRGAIAGRDGPGST